MMNAWERVAGATILTGIVVTLYAIYVDYKVAELGSGYEALCDVSEVISCTKVLESEYSHLWAHIGVVPKGSVLDQPNCVYGLAFYLLEGLLFLSLRRQPWAQTCLLWLSAIAMVLCAYLSHILADVLHTICLVCYATYAVNALVFVCFARLYVLYVH